MISRFYSAHQRRAATAALIGAACVGLLGSSPAAAQAVPDASCPGPGITLTATGTARLAQTFAAQNTGTLTRAQIDISKGGSAAD